MAHCARCGKFACLEELPAKVPTDCPMGEDATIYEESLAEYKKLLCVLCASAVNMGSELPDDHFDSSVPGFSDLVFSLHLRH